MDSYLFHNNNNEINELHASGSVYGLERIKCPPQIKELIQFEDYLVDFVENSKFHKVRNDFQMKLHKDLRKVRPSKKSLTFADKTSNKYRLEKEEYNHLLQNAGTTAYKKSKKNKMPRNEIH